MYKYHLIIYILYYIYYNIYNIIYKYKRDEDAIILHVIVLSRYRVIAWKIIGYFQSGRSVLFRNNSLLVFKAHLVLRRLAVPLWQEGVAATMPRRRKETFKIIVLR